MREIEKKAFKTILVLMIRIEKENRFRAVKFLLGSLADKQKPPSSKMNPAALS